MRRAGSLQIVAVFVVVAVPVVVACGGKLDGQDNGSGSGNTSGTPSSSASGTSSASGSTKPGTQPPPLCDSQGLSTQSGSTCAVSFKRTIFPNYLSSSGTWRCADSNCHGPSGAAGTSVNLPTIDDSDPKKAYAVLVSYSFQNKPYVDACSLDPNASGVLCNLSGACQPRMPQSGGGVVPSDPTPQEIADVKTWLSCGAPFN